jgi:hypothetical protein
MGWVLASTLPIYAQESSGFEKIRGFSPQRKFPLRSWCGGEPINPGRSNSDLITTAKVASLSSKTGKLQIT